MGAIRQAAEQAGLLSACIYASAVYALFLFLNRNASSDAKKQVSAWLQGKPSQRLDLAVAIEGAFATLYGMPLLSLRSFVRSAIVSLLVTVVVVWRSYSMAWFFFFEVPAYRPQWIGQMLTNVLSDYLSLFVVYHFLKLGRSNLLLSVVAAPILGSAVVAGLYLVRDVTLFSINTRSFHFRYFWEGAEMWIGYINNHGSNFAFLTPALLVNAWLPLFGIAAVFTRVVASAFKAMEISYWFIKRRNEQPFKAIGLIASSIVFVVYAVLGALSR